MSGQQHGDEFGYSSEQAFPRPPAWGTKKKLLEDPGSCLNKSTDGELVFLLAERDPVAAETVEFWASRRIACGIDAADAPKIADAVRWSEAVNVSPVRLGDAVKATKLPTRPVSTGTGSREFSEYVEITDAETLKLGFPQAISRAGEFLANRAMCRTLFESMTAGYALQHTFAVRLTFHGPDGGRSDRPSQTIPKGGTARLTSYTVIHTKPALFIDENGKPQNYPKPGAAAPVPVDGSAV